MLENKINNFSNEVIIRKVSLCLKRSLVNISYFSADFYFNNYKKLPLPITYKKIPLIIDSPSTYEKIQKNFKELANIYVFPKPLNYYRNGECINDNIQLKLVILGNEIIAICNDEENQFLLLSDLSGPTITKEDLGIYITKLLCKKMDNILEEFSLDIKALSNFLPNYKMYISNLTLAEFEELQDLISKISEILNH